MAENPNDKRRILVVDDEPSLVQIVKAILEYEGYTVLTSFDGPTALVLARQAPPDLIIMDFAMPEMDGFQVCRALQANPRTAGIPVLMLTGQGQIDDQHMPGVKGNLDDGIQKRMEAFESGALQFINKPVGASELITQVREILALAELGPQARPAF